jgi:hypothetical protein
MARRRLILIGIFLQIRREDSIGYWRESPFHLRISGVKRLRQPLSRESILYDELKILIVHRLTSF